MNNFDIKTVCIGSVPLTKEPPYRIQVYRGPDGGRERPHPLLLRGHRKTIGHLEPASFSQMQVRFLGHPFDTRHAGSLQENAAGELSQEGA